jgi:hypothetical protein
MQQQDSIARLKARVKEAGWGVTIDETLAFQRPDLKQLLELWQTKAVARGGLPLREDFDMRALKPFLRHLSIVERMPDEAGRPHFKFRLHGSLMAQQFGDQTGKFLENAVPPHLVEGWNLGYDAILEAGRPVRVISFYGQENANYLTGETFAVPLGSKEGGPVAVMAATYFTPRHDLKQTG